MKFEGGGVSIKVKDMNTLRDFETENQISGMTIEI